MNGVRLCHKIAGHFLQNGRSSFILNHMRNFALDATTKKNLDALVVKNKVVVFMKGEKDSPRCGFSNAVTQILRMHDVDFDGVNVLADNELREAVKQYSQWPTIPQVFINGEFVGGCDILLQMHQNGELVSLLKKNGITSALKDAAPVEETKN